MGAGLDRAAGCRRISELASRRSGARCGCRTGELDDPVPSAPRPEGSRRQRNEDRQCRPPTGAPDGDRAAAATDRAVPALRNWRGMQRRESGAVGRSDPCGRRSVTECDAAFGQNRACGVAERRIEHSAPAPRRRTGNRIWHRRSAVRHTTRTSGQRLPHGPPPAQQAFRAK